MHEELYGGLLVDNNALSESQEMDSFMRSAWPINDNTWLPTFGDCTVLVILCGLILSEIMLRIECHLHASNVTDRRLSSHGSHTNTCSIYSICPENCPSPETDALPGSPEMDCSHEVCLMTKWWYLAGCFQWLCSAMMLCGLVISAIMRRTKFHLHASSVI